MSRAVRSGGSSPSTRSAARSCRQISANGSRCGARATDGTGSPHSRMRCRLEKASGRPREGDNDQALIGDTIGELDRVLTMFASLTRISQIEAKDRTAGFRTVTPADIAGEVVELFDAAAEHARVALTAAGDP